MDKIVIRTDQTDLSSHMLSLLNTLFPECDIDIVIDEDAQESGGMANWLENEI